MIDKCANPSCSTLFRRLGRGKVFAFETRVPVNVPAAGSNKAPLFFWLCEDCSLNHRLAMDAAGNVRIETQLASPRILEQRFLSDARLGEAL